MSESWFLAQQIATFLEAHPHEHGWIVYEYRQDLAAKLSLPLLFDFVRDKYPNVVRRQHAVRLVAEEELFKTPGDAEEGRVGGTSIDLNSIWWKGTIEMEWEDSSIHFLTYPVSIGVVDHLFLVATKSAAALRSFHRALDAYGHSRLEQPRPTMYVVNGEDMPIVPVSWDELVLPPGLAESIQRDVTAFFASGHRYRALGIPYRRGFLLTGPPGCGKTLTLKALAHNTPAKFITVLGRSDVDDDHIQAAFYRAERHAPAVVVFEDMDKLIDARGISLSHFLNLLDGFKVLNGILVIATSNEPDKLDPALLHRPSRFDRVWRFSLPKYEQRLLLLKQRGAGLFSQSALEEVARQTEGFSMTYVQEVVVNALLTSLDENTVVGDQGLRRSLETLRLQRKEASKREETVIERNGVGFVSRT